MIWYSKLRIRRSCHWMSFYYWYSSGNFYDSFTWYMQSSALERSLAFGYRNPFLWNRFLFLDYLSFKQIGQFLSTSSFRIPRVQNRQHLWWHLRVTGSTMNLSHLAQYFWMPPSTPAEALVLGLFYSSVSIFKLMINFGEVICFFSSSMWTLVSYNDYIVSFLNLLIFL